MMMRFAMVLLGAAMVAAMPVAQAKTVTGDCSLTVDGKVYVDIKKS